MKEKHLQTQCETYLQACGIPYLHLTTFIRRKCNCGRWCNFSVEGNKGSPDLHIYTTSGMCFVELKTPTGRLSKAQKYFKQQMEEIGYSYFIIRSFDDFKELIDTIRLEGYIPTDDKKKT